MFCICRMLLSQPCPIFIIIYNLILVGRVLHFSGSLLLKKNKRRASELLARNHYICTIADCEQSLFSSDLVRGVHARERLSCLAPFITHVVIFLSRAFRSKDLEKRETARSLCVQCFFSHVLFYLRILLVQVVCCSIFKLVLI